jgi:condensin complex subunit 1
MTQEQLSKQKQQNKEE